MSLEAVYYPRLLDANKSITAQTRASLGMGVNVPINDLLNISIYTNLGSVGTKVGDIERMGYLNFTF